MTLAAHAFRNFIKFRTHDNFIRQHSAVCKSTFHPDPNWDDSSIQKHVCAECRSVAFTKLVACRAPKSQKAVRRAPASKIDAPIIGHEIVFEGYIPKHKLGLLNKSPDPLRTTKKKCIGCESWAPSEVIKDGLCPSCRNSGPILSTTDYEDFYSSDTTETWQQGQRHEVNSREVWVPPVPESSHRERHAFNHIMWMFVRGVPELEIKLEVAWLSDRDRGDVNRFALFTRAQLAAAVPKDQHGWMTNHVNMLINAGVAQKDIQVALSKLMWG